jgi:hypothetical protein
MSTFTPDPLTPYKKTFPPQGDGARQEYLDQQLRYIEVAINTIDTAIVQLQDEMALIWTELVALGRSRP